MADVGCPVTRSSTFGWMRADRKSTRLNSSHTVTSYADFCLKKKILGFEVHARVRGDYVDPALRCTVDRPVAHEWNSSEKGRDVDQMSSAPFLKVRNDSLHPVENRFKNNRSYLVNVLVC